jgi:hypothetical protein
LPGAALRSDRGRRRGQHLEDRTPLRPMLQRRFFSMLPTDLICAIIAAWRVVGQSSRSRHGMSSTSLPVLKGKRVTLRRPREDDFRARLRLGADAEIFRMYRGNLSDVRPMTEGRPRPNEPLQPAGPHLLRQPGRSNTRLGQTALGFPLMRRCGDHGRQ